MPELRVTELAFILCHVSNSSSSPGYHDQLKSDNN